MPQFKPQFNTFDLGRVLQTAEAIKGMRREEENDRLRNAYMGEQIQHMQGSRKIAQEKHASEAELASARRNYLVAQAATNATDPHAAIRQFAPDFIQEFEQAAGAGAFERMTPDQLKAAMGQAQQFYGAKAGFTTAGGTPEQTFVAKRQEDAASTEFDRQKELAGLTHEQRLEQIDRQGQYSVDRAQADSGRKTFRDQQALRKEFEGMEPVKNFRAVQPIIQSAKNAPDTGYGDLDMIYAVGKILDPNSVVREGELALTIAAGSPLQRILGTTRFSIERGGRLTPESRRQLLQMLEGRVGALGEQYEAERQRFAQYAQENGWDAAQVVGAGVGGGAPREPQQQQNVIDWSQLK